MGIQQLAELFLAPQAKSKTPIYSIYEIGHRLRWSFLFVQEIQKHPSQSAYIITIGTFHWDLNRYC
jgi:hypothetical protein